MKKILYIIILLSGFIIAQKQERKIPVLDSIVKSKSSQETSTLEVPRRVSYQGLLTKSNGRIVSDGSYQVSFRFYRQLEGGTSFWEETQGVSIQDGIISTVLGKRNPIYNIPSEAYLEIEINGDTMSPRQELTSVFYSVISDTAKYAQNANYSDLENLPDLSNYVKLDTLTGYTLISSLDSIAFTGDYNDLENLPDFASLMDTLIYFQPKDSNLTAIAGLWAPEDPNNIIISTDSGWVSLGDDSMRASLGLEIGRDVQPYDSDLNDLSDGTLSAGKIEFGEYFIMSSGASGQVWTSDSDGRGNWAWPLVGDADVVGISVGTGLLGGGEEVQIKAQQVSLFPIIPSISWNFKF